MLVEIAVIGFGVGIAVAWLYSLLSEPELEHNEVWSDNFNNGCNDE